MKTEYVLGFAFDDARERVALIRKVRPYWQRGHLNGIGGHVEPGEKPLDAMVREFREEAGAVVAGDRWENYASVTSHDYVVHVYSAFGVDLRALETTTDEKVEDVLLALLPEMDTMGNIPTLIAAALCGDGQPADRRLLHVELRYG